MIRDVGKVSDKKALHYEGVPVIDLLQIGNPFVFSCQKKSCNRIFVG